METVKEPKMNVQSICNELKVNKNTRAYIEHKYKGEEFLLKDWKTNLKKDGLSI